METPEFSVSVGQALAEVLTEEERQTVSQKLWELLKRRAALYTMAESSSLPVETAQELLSSLLFTLEAALGETGQPVGLLAHADLDPLLARGIHVIRAKTETGRRLLQAARNSAPEIENIALRDTLRNLGDFFHRYDVRYFAHQIPCDIDYPLCRPVPESLQGVEYVIEYLRRVLLENAILARFSRETVIRLLSAYCPDYRGLLINLCDPVITNAVGRILLGEDPLPLAIAEPERLAALFEPLPESRSRAFLRDAAGRLCSLLAIPEAAGYVSDTAEDLYPRIAVALDGGNLDGIFLSPAGEDRETR